MSDFDAKMRETLEHIVTELLKTQPEDPIPHMLHLLDELTGKASAPLSIEEKAELEKLRAQAKKVQQTVKDDDESEKDSSEDEDVSDLPVMGAKSRVSTGPRISVSAEAYGKYNKKAAFKGRVIAKPEETK
jgi:hypothetical protein